MGSNRRFGVSLSVAVTLIALAAIVPAVAEQPEQSGESVPEAASAIPVTFAGVQVGVDPESGSLRPLTPAEKKKLAAEMKKMFAGKGPKPAHTRPVFRKDGSLSAVLPLDYLSYSVVRLDGKGELVFECASSLDEAVAFIAADAERLDGATQPGEN